MSRHGTRFPYWLVERWFCWFCWGMSRYRPPDGEEPLASVRGSFRSAVACARALRNPRYRCRSCKWSHHGSFFALEHAQLKDHWVEDTEAKPGKPRYVTHGRFGSNA